MQNTVASIAVLMLGALCFAPHAGLAQQKQEQSKQNEQTRDRKAPQASSLTGCIDEQDGQYVLIHDRTRDLIANLEAEGFPVEGFARHLGHKVTVRGTASSNGAKGPVFKVRAVDAVSDSCGSKEL